MAKEAVKEVAKEVAKEVPRNWRFAGEDRDSREVARRWCEGDSFEGRRRRKDWEEG